MDNNNIITFITGDNEEEKFELIEQTKLNGQTYLLAMSELEDETAYIFKDLSKEEEETSVYEIVDNEEEIHLLSKVFEELLDDVDIELD